MSEASIIQQLTLNQVSTFTTTTSINRVKVHNDSSYYLRVYFGLGAPSRPDSGGWHDTVSPGASPVLAVVGAARAVTGLDFTNNQSTGTYQGQIVILPFLPVGAPSPTGVIGGAALCYVTGYLPDEYAETAGQVEAYVQAAKQGRLQEVLGGCFACIGTTDQGSAANTIIGTTIGPLTAATCPTLFARNAVGQCVVNCYLWSYGAMAFDLGGGVNGSVINYTLNLAVMDAGLTVTRGFIEVFRGFAWYRNGAAANTWDGSVYSQAWPSPGIRQIGVAQSALQDGDVVALRFTISGVTGNLVIQHDAGISIDTVNQTPLTAFPFPANPAWALNNPQTY